MWEQAITALQSFLTWPSPLYLLLGATLGFVFGVIPGLGGTQALALLLPLTLSMSQEQAIITLIGVIGASTFGGSITAILLNTPGTSQNAATVFDGYPLAKQGKAGMALGAAATASLMGAVVGVIILTLILPFGRYIVLAFSYPEYVMIALMGLSVIAVVSQGSMWKALIAGGLGFIFAAVGNDPITGELRFTFGIDYLFDGIKMVPALIGLFAISEAFKLMLEKGTIAKRDVPTGINGVWKGVGSVFKHFGVFIRSSIIGTIIGIIPGVGGTVANFIAYGQTVQTSKNKEMFGKGDIRGVIGPESANNAKDGGALVPTLIFGIPGSAETAVLLGALILHGIQPGPRLMLDHPTLILELIYALLAANIIVSVLGIFLAPQLTKLTKLPVMLIAPNILVISLLGAYMTQYEHGDVVVALLFGLLGYIMYRFGFSRIPLVIALVLGGLLESNYHQTLKLFGIEGFFNRPLSLVLFLITIFMITYPLMKRLIKSHKDSGVGM